MTAKRSPRIPIACFIVGILLALATAAVGQSRIIAIGDVHGAYPEFVSILQETGMIDAKRAWSGGSVTLVQTGDVLDRGRQSRDCLDLLMTLQRQAGKTGGKVVPLLGNHEVMNIMGDLRYVSADIFRTFAGDRSEASREQAHRDYVRFFSGHKNHEHSAAPTDDPDARRKWDDAHPLGFFEYRDAFGPEGKYGTWIRAHQAVVKIGDGIFVHGGLNPALQFDLDGLDKRIRAELTAFDVLWQSLVRKKVIWRYMTLGEATRQAEEELKWMQAQGKDEDSETLLQIRQLLSLGDWMALSEAGPLWYRGLAQQQEDKLMDDLKHMLVRLNAKYIVAGHTVVSKSSITARFENHVFLIDVGMLKEVFGGRAAALEIKDGQFTAHYSDGESETIGK